MWEGTAIAVHETSEGCVQFATRVLPMAERHLAAFARAVNELYGSEQARLAADDWIEELELMDWPEGETASDWRRLTVAAAALLAKRVNLRSQRNDRMRA